MAGDAVATVAIVGFELDQVTTLFVAVAGLARAVKVVF